MIGLSGQPQPVVGDNVTVGTMVRMTCYTAGYRGTLRPSSEVEELAWLTYADRDRVSAVDRLVFDHLREVGGL